MVCRSVRVPVSLTVLLIIEDSHTMDGLDPCPELDLFRLSLFFVQMHER